MGRTLTPGTRVVGPPLVLHGHHPLRGNATTWHVTPVEQAQCLAAQAEFVVERAEGHISDPAAWSQVEKEVLVMTATETRDLVQRIASR
ncbi:hypothetical protein [Cellulomonas bogoriensis]|uniref:Uncharacterized protein n=1 Tax=Cellulomonas bogoriensis 69B4 = DSM 16987 TaxID=1386082 RepID=A0A0A0BT80_9CELL|nr:hypothetical protein [Cellulomonas bogoriensis]KGM11135.1 hypothetical protein N869_03635 [Cellulomonas bogoriensis 69B4 = DSM 16987]